MKKLWPKLAMVGGGKASIPASGPDPKAAATPDSMTSEPTPAEREQALVKLVEERYDLARRAKEPLHRTWALCLAFYLGRQYERWEPMTKRLVSVADEDLPPWRERIIDNQITNLVTTAVAKWNRARHLTIALPNNPNDPEDLRAASLSTKVLRHLDRVTQRHRKRREGELLRAIYGTSFLLPYWDPQAQTMVALVDPESGLVRGREAYVGEQQFEVASVWEVFPQPVHRWDDVQWCIKAKIRPLDWIREMFPERGPLVAAEERYSDVSSLADARQFGSELNATDAREPSARVLEYYERPCRRYPRGRWIITAGSVLLYAEDALPHPRHRFPFIPQFCTLVPGRLWGKGIVEDLLGQQDLLNKNESKIQENINLTARPKYQIAREARVSEDALDSEPGEVVEWNATAGAPPPGPIPTPNMPVYAAEMPAVIVQRMRSIAGIHEVSHANVPPGVKSGIAISLLQQQDDTRLSLASDDAADAWRELDQQMLEAVAALYTVPRMIRVFGQDQGDEALALMGTDLRGNTEVALDSSQGVSDSLDTKRQRYIDYFQSGMLPPDPQVLVRVFRALAENELAELLAEHVQAQQRQQSMAALQALAGAGGGGPIPNGAAPGGSVPAGKGLPPELAAALSGGEGAIPAG